MSVTPRRSRFYFEDGSPVNHDPLVLGRTQDLPPLFEENSNLYVAARDVILASRRRIGANPVLFPIGPEEAWDIDEELDFFIAEALLARRTP
jgi:CMP-N-acetylneuraminic acid synthetase